MKTIFQDYSIWLVVLGFVTCAASASFTILTAAVGCTLNGYKLSPGNRWLRGIAGLWFFIICWYLGNIIANTLLTI